MEATAGSRETVAAPTRTAPHARVRRQPARGIALAVVVALAVFWLAYDGGTYSLADRTAVAIVVWWVVGLGVAIGVLPRSRPTPSAAAGAALLAAIAGWTALSLAWVPDRQTALEALTRPVLYLGIFSFAVLAARRSEAGRWADGLGIAIVGLAVVALGSRLFPEVVVAGEEYSFLPYAATRLNFPLGYWNGLAIFCALAVPFLLRMAVVARHRAARAAAVAALPTLAAVVYLTSSRGGVATAAVAALAFVALTPRRIASVCAVAAGGAGAVAAVAVLHARPQLVNTPDIATAADQGHGAAVWIVSASIAAAAAYAALDAALLSRRTFARGWERSALGALAATLVVGVVLSNPVQRFETFKQLPPQSLRSDPNYVGAHLAAGSGNGRWQYWHAAIDQFRTEPLHGGGAGSYTEWWVQHRTIATFVLDAHSLYAQVLGELGIVGFALVAALIGLGVALALRGDSRGEGSAVTTAAFGAAFVSYAVSAGIDWMWELPAVTVVALVSLALLAASRTSPGPRPVVPVAARAAVVAVALVAIGVQAVPLMTTERLHDSEAAVRRGDPAAALDAARSARRFQPWAYAPYLQIALVEEQLGRLAPARAAIRDAIARDPRNWQLWLVKARLETKAGRIAEARVSLRKIRELNAFPGIYGLST